MYYYAIRCIKYQAKYIYRDQIKENVMAETRYVLKISWENMKRNNHGELVLDEMIILRQILRK